MTNDDDTARLLRETFTDAERLIPGDHPLPSVTSESQLGGRRLAIIAAVAAVSVVAVVTAVVSSTGPGSPDTGGGPVAATSSHAATPPASSAVPTTGQPSPRPISRAAVYATVITSVAAADRPAGGWPVLLVLDAPHAGVGDPPGKPPTRGTPFAPATRAAIASALRPVAPVRWVPSRAAAADDGAACPKAKDDGLVVTVGPVKEVAGHLEVGVDGWQTCQAAHTLTYRLDRTGTDWRITGTVGPQIVS